MKGIYEEFRQRGLCYQCTDEDAVARLLEHGAVTFYIGFDPTADSLHVGSLIPIIAMVRLQQAGHRPIALTGAGTAMVGDPSGKTEMRRMLSEEEIRSNATRIAGQLARFLELDGQRGLALDNSAWLADVGYIDFLRRIGRHFSVNRMLAAESYRLRLESGLSFLEFNYMLLQAYDFLVLCRDHQCLLQLGGQDQWGNIVAGTDLVRREMSQQAYGLTFPLLTDASGQKLGKTVAGAIWLAPEKTSDFDFYQYWRNVDDADVERFLKLFTFLPVAECEQLGALQPPLLNRAKEILAFEVTRFVRGPEAASATYLSVVQQFGQADLEGLVATSSAIRSVAATADSIPTLELPAGRIAEGLRLPDLVLAAGLADSLGEARRLIQQGGIKLGDRVPVDFVGQLKAEELAGEPILRRGKKRMVRIRLV